MSTLAYTLSLKLWRKNRPFTRLNYQYPKHRKSKRQYRPLIADINMWQTAQCRPTISLVVRIVGLIAISHKFWEWKFCTSITGRGSRTIRDLVQLATFTTNFRHVLCDLYETRFDSLIDCLQWDGAGNKIKRGARTGGTYYVQWNKCASLYI